MKVGTDAVVLGAYVSLLNGNRILDIGTGSGIIALLLAQRSPAQICGIDIDPKSIEQANENAAQSPWSDRVKFEQSSLQDYAKNNSTPFDLIVSNPPFFDNAYKAPDLSRNNARHTDTLSHEALIKHAERLMHENSRLSIIIPIEYQKKMEQIGLVNKLFLSDVLSIQPKPSKPANRVILEFCKTEITTTTNDLTIRNEDNSYHESYKNLTQDFYLKF